MRNFSRMQQALELLQGGGSPRQIQSALDRVDLGQRALPSGQKVRELNNSERFQNQLSDDRMMENISDPWDGSYTSRDSDVFEQLQEQSMMERFGLPSFGSGNSRVSLSTPPRELSPAELKAQQATRDIINNKLMQIGLGGLAAGSTAAVINNQQGDDKDSSIILNPVTGAVVGTGIAAGLGGLTGYHLTNAPSREMALDMSKDRKRGSGNGYQRDAAFERDYGKKYDRKVRERGNRGGMKGAAIGAGGVALLQLLDAMKNDGSGSVIY
jgi:hypothetical protein